MCGVNVWALILTNLRRCGILLFIEIKINIKKVYKILDKITNYVKIILKTNQYALFQRPA